MDKKLFSDIFSYYALPLKGFNMISHRHPYYEIMYTVSGSCTIQIHDKPQLSPIPDSEKGSYKNLILKERQFILIDQGIPHKLIIPPDDRCTLLNIEFSINHDQGALDLTTLSRQNPSFYSLWSNLNAYASGYDSGRLCDALKDLIYELTHSSKQDSYHIYILFIRLMIELEKNIQNQVLTGDVFYIKKALQFMDNNLYEEISISDIASHIGIHPSYFKTLFSRHMHIGPTAYINKQRTEHAAFLLRNSHLKITDIAFQTGFNSRQHFFYTFEKNYGVSPYTYRKTGCIKEISTSSL